MPASQAHSRVPFSAAICSEVEWDKVQLIKNGSIIRQCLSFTYSIDLNTRMGRDTLGLEQARTLDDRQCHICVACGFAVHDFLLDGARWVKLHASEMIGHPRVVDILDAIYDWAAGKGDSALVGKGMGRDEARRYVHGECERSVFGYPRCR